MKGPQYPYFIILLGLLGLSSAWPIVYTPVNLIKRLPQSYSVVAVDGGSTATLLPSTKTVTDAITQTSFVVSTISPAAWTPVAETVTYETTILASVPATVTVPPSSIPYDDGQWHTTYYFRATATAVANANQVAESAVSPSPTTSIDPGQWAAWSGQNNGQYDSR